MPLKKEIEANSEIVEEKKKPKRKFKIKNPGAKPRKVKARKKTPVKKKKKLKPETLAKLKKMSEATAKDGVKRKLRKGVVVRQKAKKNPLAMGNEKGFAAYFGQAPAITTKDLLRNLGLIEPALVSKIMKDVPNKRDVSKIKFEDIYTDEVKENAYENAQDSVGYSDIDWIKGISSSASDFYLKNQQRYSELPEKSQNRIDKIEDKIRDNLLGSVDASYKKSFPFWKKANKGKSFTKQEAIDSFKDY